MRPSTRTSVCLSLCASSLPYMHDTDRNTFVAVCVTVPPGSSCVGTYPC